jgi:hypothetical protein
MDEILPGLHHWTAFHDGIRMDVGSFYVEGPGVLIDPMLPDEGLDWFRERRPPELAVLTIRHHYRQCDAFVKEFGIEVWCHEDGLHEFEGGPDVKGYAFGDTLAPGITALEMDVISPDDAALHIDVAEGALSFGDALVHYGGGQVGFVPDALLGDDPEEEKRGMRAMLKRLATEQQFEHLLFAHGDPIVGGGRAALARFLET